MKTTDLINQQMQAAGPSTYDSHPDHEVQMARSDLYRAGKCAIQLHNMLKGVSEQQGLEGWVQAKITKASDYLESVYHYLDYEMKSPSEPTYESKRRVREAAPVGNQAPVAPGQVPPGQQAGAAPVDPNQMSKAQMAGQMLEKRKEIMKELQQKEQEVAQLRQQLTQIPAISETTSAGAIASSMGGNGLGKSKTEVGSLFGGTYKTKKKIKEAPHSNAPRLSVAESANTLFDVTVIDPKTGNEKTMEISALTATEAKSKVAGKTVEVDGERKHYKVISVKSAWNEAANPAQQAATAIAKKKSGKYDKEGKRIREDDDLDHVIGIRNKMNAATDPAEKSRLQQQYDMVTSTFSRIPPTSFPATDQPAKQDQPTSEAGNPINKAKKGASMESSIGPKFTGYWKGTDKSKPGKKMVGGD
jgi:hypothetical protein